MLNGCSNAISRIVGLRSPLIYTVLNVSLLSVIFVLLQTNFPERINRSPTTKKDSDRVVLVGVDEERVVYTTHQCSSVLDYIQYGVSINSESADVTTTVKTFLPSIHDVWEETVHPKLLRHAIRWAKFKLGNNKTAVNLEKMRRDFTQVHHEFIIPRLRKSLVRPMNDEQVQRILRIIEDRLIDPINNPRLEIMTFGGSVVQGWHSEFHNWFQPGFENVIEPDCASYAWPARLEAILNEVIFHGQDVVRVTNMAVGGTTSDVGAIALEYGLLPPDHPGPDIIIHSYGVNDGRRAGDDYERFNLMQDFIRAARAMNCDVEKQPSIILYDDFMGFYSHDIYRTMAYSEYVSKAAAWYDLMAVSYANVYRHTVFSGEGFGNETAVEHEPGGDLPMLGWSLEIHPGMLYHSTSPWMLVYNLLDNMINSCQDYATMTRYEPVFEELPLNQIPELTKDSMLSDLPKKWNENIVEHTKLCAEASNRKGNVCAPTSWVDSAFTGSRDKPKIDEEMERLFLSDNEGWQLEEMINSKPRPGWVAFARTATFTITVKDHEGITFVTIIAMKSYGAKWKDSRVRVTLFDDGPSGKGPISNVGLYEIPGSHDTTTSVLFPHKLHLDGDGVPEGNWLTARFDLVGGTTFRIQGMLFCTR